MRSKDWTRVASATGNSLKPGFYVLRITQVDDYPSREYLKVTYDVADGPLVGCFSTLGPDQNWRHQFTRSYSDKSEAFFKKFLEDLEASNISFGWQDWQSRSNEQEFVGLSVGACVQERLYTNEKGEDKKAVEVVYTLPADDVRQGRHGELPEPRDQRRGAPKPSHAEPYAQANDDYSDVPF